jgi:hypothetical protein
VNVLDMLAFEAGAFCVMDRGYVDFEQEPMEEGVTLSHDTSAKVTG